MFVLKLISVVLSVHFGWTLTAIEDQFLNQQLMEHFSGLSEDISGEIIAGSYQKREASEVADDDKKYASLFSPINFTKSHHYWTRKRGREPTAQSSADDGLYTVYPTRSYGLNSISNNNSRKKREAMKKYLARTKRQVELKANSTENGDLITKNIPREIPREIPRLPSEHEPALKLNQHNHHHHRDESRDKNFGQRIGRKANKCCAGEQDFSSFNESLVAIKSQCLIEVRQNRKNISDDVIEGDGQLYTMFSCERVKRWKTVVTCTIDCFAQKLGMFDSNGVISTDVAKRVVGESFANQEWEQDASDDLVEKCSKEVTVSTSEPVNAFGFQCNSKAAEFVYCMWRESFLMCPVEKQQNTKHCEKMRSVLTKFSENKFSN